MRTKARKREAGDPKQTVCPLSQLHLDPRARRSIESDPNAIARLVKTIKAGGPVARPIVRESDGSVVAGSEWVAAAKQAGLEEIECTVVDDIMAELAVRLDIRPETDSNAAPARCNEGSCAAPEPGAGAPDPAPVLDQAAGTTPDSRPAHGPDSEPTTAIPPAPGGGVRNLGHEVTFRAFNQLREHPRSSVIPEMTAEEYAQLSEDVRLHGIVEPLRILEDGTVLDGRHRLRITRDLGLPNVPCVVVHLKSDEDPVDWMVRAAVLRRQLTVGQRAAIALELEAYHGARAAAADRRISGRASPERASAGTGHNPRASLPEGPRTRPRDVAAKAVDVSPRTIQDAVTIAAEAPDLIADMKAGRRSVHAAKQEVKRRRATAGVSTTKLMHRPPSPTKTLAVLERTLQSFVVALDAASAGWPEMAGHTGKGERKRTARRLEEAIPKQHALAKALVAEGRR